MIEYVNVRIPLDTESELYARLEAEALRDGSTVEDVVDKLIMIGSHVLLEQRLDQWARLRK